MKQNFVNQLGFGSKGYSLLLDKKNSNYFFISGENKSHYIIKKKIRTYFKKKIGSIKIGQDRNSEQSILRLIKNLKNKKFNTIIVSGGGSVIDYSKRIIFEIRKSKKNFEFIVFPSYPGSGAETSIASILNYNDQKNIKVNENFLPHKVIYDTEMYLSLSKNKIFKGLNDSIAHCLESLYSFNKNTYSNFLGINSIRIFIRDIINNKKFDTNFFNLISLLSFNGGLAQSNSGTNLCHALAHAAEKITKIKHNECVTFFLYPYVLYMHRNKKLIKFFDKKEINKLKQYFKEEHNKCSKKLKELINNKEQFNNLILLARNDICWRLYDGKINLKVLKESILDA